MSLEKSVLEKLLKLPVDKQKEVLDFVESLEKKAVHRHKIQHLLLLIHRQFEQL